MKIKCYFLFKVTQLSILILFKILNQEFSVALYTLLVTRKFIFYFVKNAYSFCVYFFFLPEGGIPGAENYIARTHYVVLQILSISQKGAEFKSLTCKIKRSHRPQASKSTYTKLNNFLGAKTSQSFPECDDITRSARNDNHLHGNNNKLDAS